MDMDTPVAPGPQARTLCRLTACLCALLSCGAAEAKRLALVIGNDTYQNATPLQNARADARAVAARLGRGGSCAGRV
jgi:hypothetical protein